MASKRVSVNLSNCSSNTYANDPETIYTYVESVDIDPRSDTVTFSIDGGNISHDGRPDLPPNRGNGSDNKRPGREGCNRKIQGVKGCTDNKLQGDGTDINSQGVMGGSDRKSPGVSKSGFCWSCVCKVAVIVMLVALLAAVAFLAYRHIKDWEEIVSIFLTKR